MDCMFVTNNELFRESEATTVRVEGSAYDVLLRARDYVHQGHRLLSSPIGASIRMILSPVKTVLLSLDKGSLDEYSLQQIEAAIEKHALITENRGEDLSNESDYRIMDRELTLSAIAEVEKNMWR